MYVPVPGWEQTNLKNKNVKQNQSFLYGKILVITTRKFQNMYYHLVQLVLSSSLYIDYTFYNFYGLSRLQQISKKYIVSYFLIDKIVICFLH